MPKHTSGPWKVISVYGTVSVRTSKGDTIVDIARVGPIDPRALADAHLIAAAPDLLEVLEGMTDWLLPDWPLDEKDAHEPVGPQLTAGEYRAALAAIAKARGE